MATILIIAGVASAAVVDVGDLGAWGFSGSGCAAEPRDRNVSIQNAATVTVKADASIEELNDGLGGNDGSGNDWNEKWTTKIQVTWTSWPTNVLGQGSSPGNKQHTTNHQDLWGIYYSSSYQEKPTTPWTASDFELDGEYIAQVKLIVIQQKNWHWPDMEGWPGSWVSVCEDEKDSTSKIQWTAGNPSLPEVVIDMV